MLLVFPTFQFLLLFTLKVFEVLNVFILGFHMIFLKIIFDHRHSDCLRSLAGPIIQATKATDFEDGFSIRELG